MTRLRAIGLAAATLAVSLSTAFGAAFEINDGKLQRISSAGIAEATVHFPADNAASRLLTLEATAAFKLSFVSPSHESIGYAALILSTVSPRSLSSSLSVSTSDSLAAAAHADGGAGELFRRAQAQVGSVSVYLAPKKGGRFRWEWDLATTAREDIVSVARRSEGQLRAQLLLASSTKGESSTIIDLGTVGLPEQLWKAAPKQKKWPREWEMERYSAREELAWTFRQPQTRTGSVKAIIGLVAVLSPWLLLLTLSSQILPSIQFSLPAQSIPLLGSLAALEGLIAAYWLGIIDAWRLMPLAAVTALLALFSGKAALSSRLKEREAREQKAKFVRMG